jgi:hypothetical protein
MAWHPLRNVGLKIVALALGTLLWFTVTGEPFEEADSGPVTVTLEKTLRQEAPVIATIEGRPAAGFIVARVRVEPATLTVTGPETRLKSGVSVVTDRISVEGRAAGFEQEVGVRVADADVRLVEARRVKVVLTIDPADLDRPAP